jgi:nucleotide-binding universal stress UspA family protein
VSAPVLAAYDPAGRDRAPVRFAAAVAAFTGAPLQVACAYADDGVVSRLAGGQMGEELQGEPGEALDEVVRELAGDGIGAETLALGATSAPSALDLAAVEIGAALLVVGSAASGRPGRVAPGSTALRLLNGAPCAVAVVPRQWDDVRAPGTIAAAFADTPEGHAAVRDAHALARRAGAMLRVATAVQARPWMDPGPGATDAAVESELRSLAEEAAAVATPAAAGVAVDIDVQVADPADFLLAVSAEVDVLVCGSRSYGARPAALLGGVTRRVTAEAACPVILLAHGAEVGLAALIAEAPG